MTLSTHTVLVEAHAGGDLLAAASSWSAIVASAAARADRIELDLRRTADGGFVLLRGERLADGRLVAELGRRELEQVRVGDEPLALLSDKRYGDPSVFQPAALLRHARRQRQLPDGDVPPVCLLDPDGDIVRHLRRTGRARALPSWACYHTELDLFELGGREIGVVGGAVGASFAVLIAEQLAASGCELLVSITSAGRIGPPRAAGFLLIDRALRDEGTSHHYLPPGADAALSRDLADSLADAFQGLSSPVETGTSWTTDAPFRETRHAIDTHARAGVACVEMEAAALYAYAQARGRRVVCIAHLTNEMGEGAIDFEKGVADGADDALAVLERVADRIDLR